MTDDSQFNAHHGSPIFFGDYDYLLPLPDPPNLPPIDMGRALRPKNPGMPPVLYLSLGYFEQLQYIVPPAEDKSIVITGASPTPQQPPRAAPSLPEPRPREFYIGGVLQNLDPLYALILYVAFALGVLLLPLTVGVRYALLWVVMALIGLMFTFVDGPQPPAVRSSDLLWGVGAAFILSLPLVLFISPSLAGIAQAMFPAVEAGAIISYMIFAAPPAETLFFRGMLQDGRGVGAAVVGASLNVVLMFLPGLLGAGQGSTALLVVVIFSALAALYSFIRERYGLPAALACQVTVHAMLLVIPVALVN